MCNNPSARLGTVACETLTASDLPSCVRSDTVPPFRLPR